jgi:hypothetical protein
MRIIILLFTVFFCFISSLFAQQNAFNIENYKQYVKDHQDISAKDIIQMYPTPLYSKKITSAPYKALYLDSIDYKYALSNYEKNLISQNGFMVSERLSMGNYGLALADIFHKDMPVFISSDAILHALHMSYDEILKDLEVSILIPRLKELLTILNQRIPLLAKRYENDPEMKKMLRDIDLYFMIPIKLLGHQLSPNYPENEIKISEIISRIETETPAPISIFSDSPRYMDFSQFRVRGHYTDQNYKELGMYFKAMIWLGRTELYLSKPPDLVFKQTEADIQRQTIDALLISEAMNDTNAIKKYDEIEYVIKNFVGESDNVTLTNLKSLCQDLQVENASKLLDTSFYKNFQITLKKKSYAFQRILSQIIYSDPMNPDSSTTTSAFLLFGQRFIIDSYVFGKVVYPNIKNNNKTIERLLPKSLDVLFAIGNNAASQLLQPELEKYYYSSNLSCLRLLIDSYENDFWNTSLYNIWLNSIRKLNPKTYSINMPSFMQTAAYWQQKMNTQLASWAELRHDNLLYAKQSYTGGIICSFPYSFVEPFPEFYFEIKNFAIKAKSILSGFNLSTDYKIMKIKSYFDGLENVCENLRSISEKELADIPFLETEKNFLRTMISLNTMCGDKYSGWYPTLFYTGEEGFLRKTDYITADVHTVPTDENGIEVGWVMHVGTGPVNLGVFIAKNWDNQNCAFIGPVSSYYENITSKFKRLTDQEWLETYDKSPSARPSFVNLYLADKDGNSKGEGPSLMTSINDNKRENPIKRQIALSQNYPNPFNPSTKIKFSIPFNLSNSKTKLIIFNSFGEKIKTLIDAELGEGNYFIEWNGENDSKKPVSSGIYFFQLIVGNENLNGKMILLR